MTRNVLLGSKWMHDEHAFYAGTSNIWRKLLTGDDVIARSVNRNDSIRMMRMLKLLSRWAGREFKRVSFELCELPDHDGKTVTEITFRLEDRQ